MYSLVMQTALIIFILFSSTLLLTKIQYEFLSISQFLSILLILLLRNSWFQLINQSVVCKVYSCLSSKIK